MNDCRVYIVKLGGSLVTDKSRPYTLRESIVLRASTAVRRALDRGSRVAVIHGGGSYGHYEVSRIIEEKGFLEGVDAARIQYAMLLLASRITGIMLRAGVPVSVHPPHTYCNNKGCGLDPLVRDVSQGLVPLSYGDAIAHGGSLKIVSGDDIAADLASILEGACLVYAMSEEHVLSPDGRPLRVVRSLSDITDLGSPAVADHTGGIMGKIKAALRASRSGARVVITGIRGLEKILGEGASIDSVGTLVSPGQV